MLKMINKPGQGKREFEDKRSKEFSELNAR